MSALTYAAAQILRVLPRQKITRVMGKLADHHWSPPVERAVVGLYSRFYNVDFDECVQRSGYASFDEFFTRTLRPGARPVDPAREAIVSPADGRIDSMGPVHPDASFFVKGRPYRVAELLGDEEEARRYVGGAGCVIYLSPRDYHRVHFPTSGKVLSWSHIPGKLFPVGDRSVRREPGLFARNERFVTVIDGPAGRCAIVMVAAVGVGHITASYDGEVATHAGGFATGTVRRKSFASAPAVARGQELGIFNLGSTTVTIFEPGRVELRELLTNAPIKMGVPVGRILPG